MDGVREVQLTRQAWNYGRVGMSLIGGSIWNGCFASRAARQLGAIQACCARCCSQHVVARRFMTGVERSRVSSVLFSV